MEEGSHDEQKAKYDVIWREYPNFKGSSPGEAFAPFFFDGFKGDVRAGQSLIHFGCGTARVAKEFLAKGLNVTLVDISPYSLDEQIRHLLTLFSTQVQFVQACLWQLPESLKSAYWIYCCDALEYLPEETIETVLKQMAKRMRFGGYFSIGLKANLSGKNPNQPLPLTMRNKGWWENKLLQYFTIISEDAIADELYFNCRVAAKK